MTFTGAEIVAIREMKFDQPAVLRNAARLLRSVIAFHLGGKELKSRKVLMELKRGDIRQRTTGTGSELL
jgi:recombinational DNA repair protein (RecF pathway)